ncbi:hypothetical protein HU200_056545 [Digitaria exilis]|uniref:Bifunctional inhibitor/plant lipid transfer protein/seed storage helical domain-containing protein n=1 Tax=Digitaria exilis TaxID=1010633 RepID=A0A835E5Z8_9POAL|nr:hypothetical protein HU200_056545 [Digitaria exilis]
MAASSKKAVLLFIMVVVVAPEPAAACGGHPCPKPAGKCPVNTVKLGACVDACCPLISGLANLDAAVCVCLAINANVLGVINLGDVAVDLSLLFNFCGCTVPADFQCA